MKILALESSTLLGGIAVIDDGKIIFEKSTMRQKSHSEVLNLFVQNALEETGLKLEDFDAFAVGQGPGSFTGIRVAANIGKTYSFIYKKPIVTVDSLANLAFDFCVNKKVLSIINAYKNMVYYGIYEGKDVTGGPKCILGPSVIPVRNFGSILNEPTIIVGDGFLDYNDYLMEHFEKLIVRPNSKPDQNIEKNGLDFPKASTLAKIAFSKFKNNSTVDWKSFLPLYIRASEAEENKQGVVFTPLK